MVVAGVSIGVLLAMGAVCVAVLAGLGWLARADRHRDSTGLPAEEVGELTGHATAVRVAAERAAAVAAQAQQRVAYAAGACDDARARYERAERADGGDPRRLVERAALAAYRRGELSGTELNRLWQHTATDEEPHGVTAVGAGDPLTTAWSEYGRAKAAVAEARHEAYVAEVAAEALAAEAGTAAAEATAAMGRDAP